MSNEKIIKDNFKDFYREIKPLMGGGYLGRGFTPVGTIIAYYGDIAPANYLACDGSEYNKSEYPELWTHLSTLKDTTPYIVNGDNTKFKVPDLRGEFLRGSGTNSHTNQGSGSDVGIHQDASLPNITGEFNLGTTNIGNNGSANGALLTTYKNCSDFYLASSSSSHNRVYGFDMDASRSSSVYQDDAEARPTNTSVLFCIATKNFTMEGTSHTYSEEEQIVGYDYDGSPIYEITKKFNGTTTVNDSTKLSDLPENIKTGWVVRSYGYYKTGGTGHSFESLPVSSIDNCGVLVTDSEISFIQHGRAYGYTDITYTIQYTKTTD